MNIHSYTIVHYGKDYIGYAIKSIYELVDKIHIIYTPTPSHGHMTDVSCPETRKDIHWQVFENDPLGKVQWYEMNNVLFEGKQRDMAVEICQEAGADIILVQDYDEIWNGNVLASVLVNAIESGKRNNLVNFTHLWKSFNWCCKDQGWPVRIINLAEEGEGPIHSVPVELGNIYHFGYAVTDETMRYKWLIHGHKAELRDNWLDDIWSQWPPVDNCHPTNSRDGNGKAFWTPEWFDKKQLPDVMKDHLFRDLEVIG